MSNVPVGLDVNLAPADVIVGGDVHCLEFTGTALQEGIYDINVSGFFTRHLGERTDHGHHHDAPSRGDAQCDWNRGLRLSLSHNYDPLATIDIGLLVDGLYLVTSTTMGSLASWTSFICSDSTTPPATDSCLCGRHIVLPCGVLIPCSSFEPDTKG